MHSVLSLLLLLPIASAAQQQGTLWSNPTDPGMYVQRSEGFTKFIGQIAEFKRTGSILVSDATLGIKSGKVNIQLLGAHAQTVVSAQPVFYFLPAKQEADAGVNGGDLILIRLEEKSKRRQFEVAAIGLWRSSSGISLTHQIQLYREEIRPNVYRVMPATELPRGEFALYLARGEGMAPYVYDFSVQPIHEVAVGRGTTSDPVNASSASQPQQPPTTNAAPAILASTAQPSIGAFADGELQVRHDGVTLTSVAAGGPADRAGIKTGDTILSINDHYLFTITELRVQISQLVPGTKASVRYRRYSTIYDASLVVGVEPLK